MVIENIPSAGDVFTPKSDTLDVLLPSIDRQDIALPHFQRKWVWNPDMVADLIVSVAYRYPAGSILTLPVHRVSFAMRPFEGAGSTLTTKPSKIVLDGQQRLTSLYQGLYRKDGVCFRDRRFHFYLDVEILLSDPDGLQVGDPYFERALFYVAVDKRTHKRVRYDKLVPLYEINTPDEELAAGTLPLYCAFDSAARQTWKNRYLLRIVKRAGKDLDYYQELDGRWDGLVNPWLERIRNYRFPVVELDERMPLAAICHIFEKVNSTGMPLDVFDLCNAILWSQGFYLNDRWADTKGTLQAKVPMQPLVGTSFLQGLSLLNTLASKREDPGNSVAISCRRQDLMSMDKPVVERWWSPLIAGYERAGHFMTDQGILSDRILPYTTLIIPLAAILADLLARRGKLFVDAALPKIQRWYWCSVFGQRYSSQVETTAATDFAQVVEWVEGGPQPDAVRTFSFRSDSLQEITSLRNAVYRGVLCLLAREGALDFGGGGKLSTQLFFATRQDHHHIFPRAALARLRIDDPRAETIVNKTLISATVNSSIGGKLPSTYVPALRATLDKDQPGRLGAILLSHQVNPTLLGSDAWEDFFNDRRERLRELILSVCDGNVLPFSSARNELDIEDRDEQE